LNYCANERNGRISQVKVGAQVSPGTTLLNTISAEDPISVDIVINEKEIPRLQQLQNKAPRQILPSPSSSPIIRFTNIPEKFRLSIVP
jgi:hypothetical protein